MMDAIPEKRLEVLRQVAELVPGAVGENCVRVGVDGVDGSGKTVFADELAAVLRSLGRYVVRVSVDDFHNVRSTRYRRGRLSPDGFWLDSFNYDRLRADVLTPRGPGGSRRYRPAAHDLTSDQVLDPPYEVAPPSTVLVADGLFFHRDELSDAWEFSIFLDVPFEVTAARMATRDGTSPDPNHPTMQRYVGAQQLYFNACTPHQRATILIDNTTLEAPHLIHVS
ncbi:uridine kinase [Kribbella steppae]|uniref:Uridine kinase n=1 Tax=Kribbella steppae TaxID=2512223 RepID=A0A4R2HU97_9ACTN|nr:uridine kinase [Kribbella steppae]TCO34609.1 uridine kinase [Kribbella steppae]